MVLAEDVNLLRAGVKELLVMGGHEVVAEASDATELVRVVNLLATDGRVPDLVITDVRMPPDGTDDGIRAARELRTRHRNLPVLVLSAYASDTYLRGLLDSPGGEAGIGYLLKDRVRHVRDLLSAIEVVASGGVAVDPEVLAVALSTRKGPLGRLTQRESEVLQLMARGDSNAQIATELHLSDAAISKHIASIFLKLDLPPGQEN